MLLRVAHGSDWACSSRVTVVNKGRCIGSSLGKCFCFFGGGNLDIFFGWDRVKIFCINDGSGRVFRVSK